MQQWVTVVQMTANQYILASGIEVCFSRCFPVRIKVSSMVASVARIKKRTCMFLTCSLRVICWPEDNRESRLLSSQRFCLLDSKQYISIKHMQIHCSPKAGRSTIKYIDRQDTNLLLVYARILDTCTVINLRFMGKRKKCNHIMLLKFGLSFWHRYSLHRVNTTYTRKTVYNAFIMHYSTD